MKVDGHKLYPTMFLLGHRADGKKAQEVGAVIVKATFQDMDNPQTLPRARQVPIFRTDYPFNFVRNSDFEGVDKKSKKILLWQAINGELESETQKWVGKKGKSVKLTSKSLPAHLKQTLTFEQSVGGRQFILSFYAWAEKNIKLDQFRLQSVKSGKPICQLSAELSIIPQRFISQAERWPSDEESKEVDVILPGSKNLNDPIYFDRVQVEEAATSTRWDENTVFRYEHDLVPYKPYADIILLGAAKPTSVGIQSLAVDISTGQHIVKTFNVDEQSKREQFPIKALLAWAPRGEGKRKDQAGQNLDKFDPNIKALPDLFDNQFYNGYDRTYDDVKSKGMPLAYLRDGTKLTIKSDFQLLQGPAFPFTVQLPDTRPRATLTVTNNSRQEVNQDIPLVLDTVIIEPHLDRYLVLWRGTWPLDENYKNRYIQLTVQGGS